MCICMTLLTPKSGSSLQETTEESNLQVRKCAQKREISPLPAKPLGRRFCDHALDLSKSIKSGRKKQRHAPCDKVCGKF